MLPIYHEAKDIYLVVACCIWYGISNYYMCLMQIDPECNLKWAKIQNFAGRVFSYSLPLINIGFLSFMTPHKIPSAPPHDQ